MKQTTLYLLIAISISSYSQNLLTFHFSTNGNDINIEASNDNNETKSITLKESKNRLINDFNEVYWIIGNLKMKKLDFKVDSLSQVLTTLFEPLLSKCDI